MRIILVGVSCVGKSTIGQFLAEKHGLTFVDFDWEVEKQTCKHITAFKK